MRAANSFLSPSALTVRSSLVRACSATVFSNCLHLSTIPPCESWCWATSCSKARFWALAISSSALTSANCRTSSRPSSDLHRRSPWHERSSSRSSPLMCANSQLLSSEARRSRSREAKSSANWDRCSANDFVRSLCKLARSSSSCPFCCTSSSLHVSESWRSCSNLAFECCSSASRRCRERSVASCQRSSSCCLRFSAASHRASSSRSCSSTPSFSTWRCWRRFSCRSCTSRARLSSLR
mmetsp:Transcript_55170/g.147241  ORF Transcript_55170/g.147241 Transcript_55170/m.147241 type:complete len:239 (-) Transcript_55170:118-834(-)